MPAMRPPETMAILSQVCLSSSSSEEIITTVTPFSRLKRLSASSTSAFAPTSMPRVGSENEQESGLQRERLGQANLLLVAAGKLSCLLQGAGALDHQFVDVLLGYIMDGLFITPGDGADFFEEFVLDLHGGERNVPLQRLDLTADPRRAGPRRRRPAMRRGTFSGC